MKKYPMLGSSPPGGGPGQPHRFSHLLRKPMKPSQGASVTRNRNADRGESSDNLKLGAKSMFQNQKPQKGTCDSVEPSMFFPKALRRVLPKNLLNTDTSTLTLEHYIHLHLNTYTSTLTLLYSQWHRSIQVNVCK